MPAVARSFAWLFAYSPLVIGIVWMALLSVTFLTDSTGPHFHLASMSARQGATTVHQRVPTVLALPVCLTSA